MPPRGNLDPDHSVGEERYIAFGYSWLGRLLPVCRSCASRDARRKENLMKRAKDEMRREYKRSDFLKLERGKFYADVVKGTSVALLEPSVAKAFPTSRGK